LDKPDLYVVARFLDVLYWKGTPMKKTNVQTLVGLNYPRFVEYLEWLQSHGLIAAVTDEQGSDRITLSSKGIESYHRLVEWIRDTMRGIRI